MEYKVCVGDELHSSGAFGKLAVAGEVEVEDGQDPNLEELQGVLFDFGVFDVEAPSLDDMELEQIGDLGWILLINGLVEALVIPQVEDEEA